MPSGEFLKPWPTIAADARMICSAGSTLSAVGCVLKRPRNNPLVGSPLSEVGSLPTGMCPK